MNWPVLLRRAALDFTVPPHRFWALSLKEWRALAGEAAAAPLSRTDFEALAAAHPDFSSPSHAFGAGPALSPQAGRGVSGANPLPSGRGQGEVAAATTSGDPHDRLPAG